jgi:hypothetical protein
MADINRDIPPVNCAVSFPGAKIFENYKYKPNPNPSLIFSERRLCVTGMGRNKNYAGAQHVAPDIGGSIQAST